jgi:hypothetical protein
MKDVLCIGHFQPFIDVLSDEGCVIETILRYNTLAITVDSTFKGRRCGIDITGIKGSNSVLKNGQNFRLQQIVWEMICLASAYKSNNMGGMKKCQAYFESN